MGSGFGGIYQGTHGSAQPEGAPLHAVASAVQDLSPEKLAALVAAVGATMALDEVGLPNVADAFRQAYVAVQSAVVEGLPGFAPDAAEGRHPPVLSDEEVWWLADAVLSVRLLTWAASAAAELGIEDAWESDDGGGKPGIYENRKVAEAALNRLYPGTGTGARAGEVTTRFAFHEEAGGGHFGVSDSVGSGAEGRRGKKRDPVLLLSDGAKSVVCLRPRPRYFCCWDVVGVLECLSIGERVKRFADGHGDED